MKRFTLPMVALIAVATFSLAGCSGKPAKQDKPTKTAKQKLPGKWEATMEIDEAKVKEGLKKQGAPEEEWDKAVEDLKSVAKNMKFTLVLNQDGTSVATMSGVGPEPQEDKGKWEVVKESGNTATLKLTDQNGKVEEGAAVFEGDDCFKMEMPGEMPGIKATFKRAK